MITAGSSEIEVNEFTVIPCRSPAWTAVTMVTPTDQPRMAFRNCSGSRVVKLAFSMVQVIIMAREKSVKEEGYAGIDAAETMILPLRVCFIRNIMI